MAFSNTSSLTINCNGSLIDLKSPKVMGILNVTPDSFYDGGTYSKLSDVLKHVEHMLTNGATFIDVGAYSSRPNADDVSETEELKRSIPVIEVISKTFPEALISIDTFRSSVAKACVNAGASLVNDISAGQLDKEMMPTVATLQVPYIMMHMKGTPQTMTSNTNYDNLTKDILSYFSEKISEANALGINDIILDVGFGFSKTREQNFELLNHLDSFNITGLPMLVGLSRKSTIYKTLNTTASKALNGTTAMHAWALQQGSNILRVHDVKEAMEVITLYNALKSN
ncbi:dihydropteroate synthase [Croceibacter atlanticus]|uniref:dihydropteroate synthase n=1 Tax=Croceibacter atlanticus TaxID=313588 RepID=UPI0030DA0387|tara:strand:+ start:187047 stop:187898 length:852 start_codon:yes stop_codon:yes gene_type:complete